jgi:hypothetical protein
VANNARQGVLTRPPAGVPTAVVPFGETPHNKSLVSLVPSGLRARCGRGRPSSSSQPAGATVCVPVGPAALSWGLHCVPLARAGRRPTGPSVCL